VSFALCLLQTDAAKKRLQQIEDELIQVLKNINEDMDK